MNTFAESKNFKLVKLINGEDLICTIEEKDNSEHIQVEHPLKMQVIPRMSPNGMEESLNLSPWVHPYTETHSFQIPSSSIMLIADVSPGLSRYYEYVLKKIDHGIDIKNDEIHDEILESIEPDSKLFH
tara:strand:- start:871 stop:1254 length:384 start_codon:yes stop_codon:yes gene_type:complete